MDDVENENNKNESNVLKNWHPTAMLKLVERILDNIPEKDSLRPSTRLGKLNWDNIIFDDYSVTECKEIWGFLQKQVRNFRLLNEIAGDVKDWLQHLGKRKKCLHPDRPKRPLDGHMLYYMDKRKKFQEKNPTLSSMEVYRELLKQYKNLPPEKKLKYQELALTQKEKYHEEIQEFYDKNPAYIPNPELKFFKGRHAPPKKPRTPFEIFLQVEHDKTPNERMDAVFIEDCREKYKDLSDENKVFWINWAEEEFLKYKEDLKNYLKQYPQYMPKLYRPLTKKDIALKEKVNGRPEKPPKAGYQLFLKTMLRNNVLDKAPTKEKMYCIAKQWQQCTDEEKKEYYTRCEQLWEEYYSNLDEYLSKIPIEERIKIRNEKTIKRKNLSIDRRIGKKRRTIQKPEMPPLTEFDYFASVYTGILDVKQAWEKLPPRKKDEYSRRLLQKKQQYIKLFEEYLSTLTKEQLKYLAKYDHLPEDEEKKPPDETEAEDLDD